jgi:phage tail sheath protein FI
MAGIYARTDVARGVHKAPANEVIRSIRGLEQAITKREQDILNPADINVIRAFPGRGNRVWGARVATSDPAWRYVSVRRLFLMIEESIDEATQWVVFEPNDEPLWARIRQSVSRFLLTQWRIGALQGATAAEAFYVACDRSTMTPDDIDNGRLICEIGIAPVKPAEFVIFRIQQKTLETVTA